MDVVARGRRIVAEDLSLIRSLLSSEGHHGRCFVARELCRQWDWRQPHGELKQAACRALLLQLEAKGLIVLPRRKTGGIGQRRPDKRTIQLSLPSLACELEPCSVLHRVQWRLASATPEVFLYKDLINTHHYLGYRREVGHVLRYIAYSGERPIACLGWAAAAQKVACRDSFVGWSDAQRQRNLYRVVNNTRFLLLHRIPHLASHLLAANVRQLASDWQQRYGYVPVLLETFVDTTRFRGTSYKAANWISVGLTRGRGKYDRHTRHPESIKAVFVYPLIPQFRERLCHGDG